jgi:hypothetical protein
MKFTLDKSTRIVGSQPSLNHSGSDRSIIKAFGPSMTSCDLALPACHKLLSIIASPFPDSLIPL